MQLILVHSAIEETVVIFSDFVGRGFFGNFENMTLLHIHQFSRKYEAYRSKTERLRHENVFLELKVRTASFS